MPLTLVTGRANAGKTGEIHEVLREAIRRGLQPTLILPSTSDVTRARLEFATSGPRVGITVATFAEVVNGLWRLHGDGRPILGDFQRTALLSRAVEGAELDAVALSSSRPGFAKLLERLATHLTDESLASQTPGGSGPGPEIARVLSGYLRLLRRNGLVERGVAIGVLASTVEPSWFDGPVVANRFTDLSRAQERLFVAMADSGTDVTLSLPWEAGFPAARALDGLVERLADVGELRPLRSARDGDGSRELEYLASHLFRPAREALGAPVMGDVRLSEAEGEEAEAHRIACEVAAAIDEGTEPSRIAVVFRDPLRHQRALCRALKEAGLAADLDVGSPAGQTGLGRALVSLLRYVSEGGSTTDLLGFLRGPYGGETPEVVEAFEREVRRRRIVDRDRLRELLRRLGGQAAGLMATAEALVSRPVDQVTATKWKTLAGTLMRNGSGASAPTLNEGGMLDARAYELLASAVDEMATLPDAPFKAEELLRVFSEGRVRVAAGERPGRVQVLPAERARARRFDVVIVGGLVDGDFPPRVCEDALAPREVARALKSFGLELERMNELDAERLLFYLVSSRARRRLVLSRQVADPEGVPLCPSPLLDEVLDLYRALDDDVPADRLPPVSRLDFSQTALSDDAPATYRRALRELAGARCPTDVDPDAAERLASAAARGRGRAPRLSDERVLAVLAERPHVSVSEVEAYIQCPFGWFYERAIGVEGLDEEIGARVAGSVLHEVMRVFYERLPERTHARRVTAGSLEAASRLMEETVQDVLAIRPDPRTLEEISALQGVRRRTRAFVPIEARFLPDFEPAALEWAFGTAADDPPEHFDGFELAGRIDRIDRGPDGTLLIIDYKSGSVGPERARASFARRGLVQLPLYAEVVRRRFGAPIAGALYRTVGVDNLRRKQNRGFIGPSGFAGEGLVVRNDTLDEAGFEAIVADAAAMAADAVTRMRSGDIPAAPLDSSRCRTCGSSWVCGVGE